MRAIASCRGPGRLSHKHATPGQDPGREQVSSATDRADRLSNPAASTLESLGRAAASHTEFPILVVLHRAAASTAERDQPRLDQVVAALKAAGATRIDFAWGGSVTPIVEPGRSGAAERNERVEVVFVAPRSG